MMHALGLGAVDGRLAVAGVSMVYIYVDVVTQSTSNFLPTTSLRSLIKAICILYHLHIIYLELAFAASVNRIRKQTHLA